MEEWQETEAEDRKQVRIALHSSGLEVDDIYELVNRRGGGSYRKAIPALIETLPGLNPNRVKEGVVRALGVPQAKSAGPVLIKEFKALGPANAYSNKFEFHLHWAIANSLAEVATDSLFDDIVGLIRNRRYGRAREMLTFALTRMRSNRSGAIETLVECLGDEDIRAHAISALAKLKATEAMSKIENYVDSPSRLVRSNARKALTKLSKITSKIAAEVGSASN